MANPTREEFDARLEAVYNKMEASEERLRGELKGMDSKLDVLLVRTQDALDASREAKSAASSIKWNIIFTALGVLAVMLAVWGIWEQAVSMFTPFLPKH